MLWFQRSNFYRAVPLLNVGAILGKDEVAGSNPANSSICGTPKVFGVPILSC